MYLLDQVTLLPINCAIKSFWELCSHTTYLWWLCGNHSLLQTAHHATCGVA